MNIRRVYHRQPTNSRGDTLRHNHSNNFSNCTRHIWSPPFKTAKEYLTNFDFLNDPVYYTSIKMYLLNIPETKAAKCLELTLWAVIYT